MTTPSLFHHALIRTAAQRRAASSHVQLSAYFRQLSTVDRQTTAKALISKRYLSHGAFRPSLRLADEKIDAINETEQPVASSSKAVSDKHHYNFPASLRRLAQSLPSAGLRRPTKDELLSKATSFFERIRIRFKWFTIRGFRRYRVDDWSV